MPFYLRLFTFKHLKTTGNNALISKANIYKPSMKTRATNLKQIKIVVLLILFSGIFHSCKNKTEQILTDYNWEIEKIVDLKTNTINQTEINQKKTWNFSPNSTYRYKTQTENNKNQIEGKWQLDEHSLFIYNEFDSTKVCIELIDCEKMVWLINENDSLKIYLSSEAKEIVVPDFPNMNEN